MCVLETGDLQVKLVANLQPHRIWNENNRGPSYLLVFVNASPLGAYHPQLAYTT